jgi:hypothetical protein
MRRLLIRTSILAMTLLALTRIADAAPFVNLDFEQSTVQPGDPPAVPTSAAFPGWTARFGDAISSSVYHDFALPNEPIVAVYDHEVAGAIFVLLQGQYMAYVSTGQGTFTSLSQVGDIPANAKSLTLLCDGSAGAPVVTIDGIPVPMHYLSGGIFNETIATCCGDISAFAGTNRELRLTSAPPKELNSGRRAFDDVRFSATPIPEPGVSMLAALIVPCVARRSARTAVSESP